MEDQIANLQNQVNSLQNRILQLENQNLERERNLNILSNTQNPRFTTGKRSEQGDYTLKPNIGSYLQENDSEVRD